MKKKNEDDRRHIGRSHTHGGKEKTMYFGDLLLFLSSEAFPKEERTGMLDFEREVEREGSLFLPFSFFSISFHPCRRQAYTHGKESPNLLFVFIFNFFLIRHSQIIHCTYIIHPKRLSLPPPSPLSARLSQFHLAFPFLFLSVLFSKGGYTVSLE